MLQFFAHHCGKVELSWVTVFFNPNSVVLFWFNPSFKSYFLLESLMLAVTQTGQCRDLKTCWYFREYLFSTWSSNMSLTRSRHSTHFQLKTIASHLKVQILNPATLLWTPPLCAGGHHLMKPTNLHHLQKAETKSKGHQSGSLPPFGSA